MVDVLNRRMPLVVVSLCKYDLKENILNSLRKDEVYFQIKEVVQQRNEKRKYVDFKLDKDQWLAYKVLGLYFAPIATSISLPLHHPFSYFSCF